MTENQNEHAVAAVVLAAGRSRRMIGPNKLLCEVQGRPLIAGVLRVVLASSARPVVVVTGYEAGGVREALAAFPVEFVHNPDYDRGLSMSLRTGIAALPANVDGALICLGDMPLVEAGHINSLLERFERFGDERRSRVCVPAYQGRRGNPVLWGAAFFAELDALRGDWGGKSLLETHAGRVQEVEMTSGGVTWDVDTQAALAELEPPCRP